MPYWFDGNNLIGKSSAAARADARTSAAFLSALNSVRRAGGGRFHVYFDGDDPGRAAVPPGIAVRYSAPLSTDEAILRRLREIQHTSEIIVVTNDHELQRRCRNEGAKTLNWREFSSKMQSRTVAHSKQKSREEPVDIDDWAGYFGLDKTKI